MLRFTDMYKAYGSSNHPRRMRFSLTYQFAEFHKGCGRIAKSKECIGMLFHSEADTSLCAGDALRLGHFLHTGITEVAQRFYPQTL